ncbi:MAG: hypothetical protein IJH04_06095 [Eggerthellaceae bacterium]|nr:hypothetical protein [Eggerthellaceae bacterium]
MGTAVSQHGRKALHNYLFRSVRELADGNTVFSCDGNRLQNLLDRKLYFKTYRDDIYVMIPLVEHEANLRMERFIADVKAAGSGCESAAVDGVVASADSSGDPASDEEITRTLIDSVREYVAYECSNEVVRDMEFVSLGCFDFLHTPDEYPGPVFNDKRYPMGAAQAAERGKFRWATKAQQPSPCDTQAEPVDASSAAIDEACPYEVVMGEVRGYAVLAAHLKTHMFVLSVFLPDYPYSSTQMEDQVSFGYLKIRNPKNPGEYIPFYEYLLQTYGLHACGQAKCVLYMSNKPKDERELQDILAAEAYDNYETDYSISSDELKELCETNRAQFDDYEAYLSNRAIAYIHEEYSDSVLERVEDFADYLFIVIMTLFQNTALAKVNMKVTHLLETDGDVTPRAKLDIDREYGRTIRFWEMQNFKYLSSQMESAVIKEAFLNQELKDSYAEHQEYLEHVVEVKAAIADNRNGMIINVVAIILAVIQIEPFVTGVLQSVYGFLGIEADYAASTFNYTVFGGVVLFLLVLIILRRRSSYVQRRRM